MRLRHADGTTVHLGYCTNVHPAEDLAGIVGQLDHYALPVRERLGADRLGLGLWLAHDVARELAADRTAVARLRAELDFRGLEVVTLNGFPYRGFHAPVVKHAVYSPDWTSQARLAYTLDLAQVLSGLLPDDAPHGSISTLPLAWRDPWDADRRAAAGQRIRALEAGLAAQADRDGRPVRVAFEPEPGCAVETVEQIERELTGLGGDLLGLCLDVCHLAVSYEDPAQVLDRLAAAGLAVVKVQASCALQADDPSDPAVREALAAFVEPRFLHQTREAGTGGAAHAADDLGEALSGPGALPGAAPWRVHFHVPLHAPPEPPLAGTSAVLEQTLGLLFGGPAALADHVEVETYTWSVLPADRRPEGADALVAGIAAEVAWAAGTLTDLGLKEVTA
ncbi:metabolite traffic protein EboE [Streptomyces sp. NBC_01477]|uniref:metabolite traffic protein EboE n=1 Tax=Streptomyces sp. NBC_01477 TaxID=2976015 RepID=UPI002E362C3B|nr:metabolite traffic protein EboE [Streptomyces sp. NBC_01477]